jgi:arylsulfatase A-like enzyme
MTDQQFADAMSCVVGGEFIHTPNMDSLAANGVRFSRAYSPNPLCMPMRTSMITGLYPHQTGIQTNTREGFDPARCVFMGRLLRGVGSESAYFGIVLTCGPGCPVRPEMDF